MSQTRRLAAILAADVAGYSRLIGADEEGTLERLKALRASSSIRRSPNTAGRIVKTTGDGLLVEFGSVVDALRCAVEVQREHGRAQRRRTARQPHRISHRHQRRRYRGRGRRHLWRRRECRGPARRYWRSPAGSAFRRGCRRMPRASSTSPSRSWASRASRTSPGPCGSIEWFASAGSDVDAVRDPRPCPPRQAIDRGAAVPEYERRPGAGIFRRRHGRGDHHGAVAHPLAVRHRPQFELYLQGPGRRCEAGRA